MRNGISTSNDVDVDGNPKGGWCHGTGIRIDWQDGPLGRGDDRVEPNGAFVEDVIAAALQRIEHYQEVKGGQFFCSENGAALHHLEQALIHLDDRTKRREVAGTEGTHNGE